MEQGGNIHNFHQRPLRRRPLRPFLKWGMVAPKGTPKEVIDILSQAIKKAGEKDNAPLRERLRDMGAQIAYMAPEEYAAFLKRQNHHFDEVIKGIIQGYRIIERY